MTSRPVTLHEGDRDGVLLDIAPTAADALSRTELVEVRLEATGRYRVLPRGRVGAVQVGALQVQVEPREKIRLSRLLFLLGYAGDPGFRPEDVTGGENADLLPALAESLARHTERALERGVLQGYRSVEDSLRTIRGRIRFGDQLARRPGLVIPIEVAYDEFSVDTAENRILRSALRRMLAVPRLPDSTRRCLQHLNGKLDGVGVLVAGDRLPSWSASRLNQRYQPALRLAEIVLHNLSAETGEGNVPMAAFVVSMWKVFEDFVTTSLVEALAVRPGFSSPQHAWSLDPPPRGRRFGQVGMAIDLVHLAARDTPQLIFDAKYKYADASGRYPNGDHYQMLAYCTALGVDRAWLIYAQGGAHKVERKVRNSGVTIVEYPLDLSGSPTELLGQIDRLAECAWLSRADAQAPSADHGHDAP